MSSSAAGTPETDPLPQTPAAARIDSLHSANFPDLLRQLGGSLLVSSGASGKLVILRPDGNLVGTHCIDLPQVGGIAADSQRIALAAAPRLIELHNFPDVARQLHDPPRHDAVYLTRRGHVTGAAGIGEMAWDRHGTLWFTSTLFSSLCTLDAQSALVPRWRPRFVSRCVPEDRCHLNGLGLRDGEPRYVTALGETDSAQGWRGNKNGGGVLIDCSNDAVLARGLALPHSPRWYDGRLWLLESGRGVLVCVDPHSGHRSDVAFVPGFARGLAFLGPVAFIGVSPRRAADTDAGNGATAGGSEQHCGIRAVHIGSGRSVALLTFSANLAQICAVQALPGVLFPEFVCAGDLLAFSYALPPQALREVDPGLLPAGRTGFPPGENP